MYQKETVYLDLSCTRRVDIMPFSFRYVFSLLFFLPLLQSRADFFSDRAVMHISQDLTLTKNSPTTYHNVIVLPDQQFCEVKYSLNGMAATKEKLLLAYGYDNLTAKELKTYKPRVIANSYLVKSQNYLRKAELTVSGESWNDSNEARYCRKLELSVFNKYKQQTNSRMPAAAVADSVKRTFYSACTQTYNILNFEFVTETKFHLKVSCNLLTDDKKQVISLLQPYFFILD